jgi:hypothetical protein
MPKPKRKDESNEVTKPNKQKEQIKTKEQKEQKEQTEQKEKKSNPNKGRKSRGGKVLKLASSQDESIDDCSNYLQQKNIILHLRCSMNELKTYCQEERKQDRTQIIYSPEVPGDSLPYDQYFNTIFSEIEQLPIHDVVEEKEKTFLEKLNGLKLTFYKKEIDSSKKAACFWCTYPYENPTCYIPLFSNENEIEGYGSFCHPECAVAFLFRENMNDSVKFERYHLLNYIYGSLLEYQHNIKPAPDPHFLLDKFYGNMTIGEYRMLLKTDKLINIVHSPFTRTLPEIHEEMDPTILGIYGIERNTVPATGTYLVRRPGDRKKNMSPSKRQMMLKNFCLPSGQNEK